MSEVQIEPYFGLGFREFRVYQQNKLFILLGRAARLARLAFDPKLPQHPKASTPKP